MQLALESIVKSHRAQTPHFKKCDWQITETTSLVACLGQETVTKLHLQHDDIVNRKPQIYNLTHLGPNLAIWKALQGR